VLDVPGDDYGHDSRLSVVTPKKILIVEDDVDVCLGYRVFLEANQYDTFFAADGMSAISEARKHRPDLIILDLSLPAGDGFVVLDRLRAIAHLSQIPVIVVSGRDLGGNKDRALNAGVKAFVRKPWNENELLAIIARYSTDPSYTTPGPSQTLPTSVVLDICHGSFGIALRKAA
jgi:DNA-binding response OmpR family regulator